MKNNHYENFFQLSTELLSMIDRSGHFIMVNPAFCSILGYTQEELSQKPYTSFMHPDDLEKTIEQAHQFSQGMTVQNFENRYLTKDGKAVWLSWTSSVLLDEYFYAAAKDITQQKEAEQSLQTSQKKFQSLVQNGYEIISILGADGTYQYHSDSVSRLLGYQPKELIGLRPKDLIHPDDLDRIYTAVTKLQRTPYLSNGIPYRVKAADGTYRWLESSATNMVYDPTIRGIVVNSRDVTDKVLLERELLQQSLEKEKDIALSMIQAQEKERTWLGQELHDNINQMLASVKLCIEYMQTDTDSRETLLIKSGQVVQEIIQEIRELSHRLILPGCGSFDLKQSIEDLAANVFPASRTKFQSKMFEVITTQLPEDLKIVLYRIIQEQFTNIIKYAEASLVQVSLQKKDNCIELSIADNGKGFDPLEKRSGIGLSNIANRVKVLGGSTCLDTAPGKGCQIRITFPHKAQ